MHLSILLVIYGVSLCHGFSGFFGGTLVRQILEENPNLPALDDHWFTQKLDHLDPLSTETFQQLYYVNDKYYKEGGPVFFYFNGEGPLSPTAIQGGHLAAIAEKHSGYIISHEHRYYGKSVPFGGIISNLTTKEMRFLSAQQALSDAAYFQEQFAKNHKLDANKWIIVGCSYSGALSPWYRIKYPHLVHGAYSSSGVVHAIDDFKGYHETVISAINLTNHSKQCFDVLTRATKIIQDLASTTKGLAKLGGKSMFNTCEPLDEHNKLDFFLALAGRFRAGSQRGGMNEICDTIMKPSDPVQGWIDLIGSGSGKFCMMTTYFGNWDFFHSWFWQKCTEFGFFKTYDTEYFPGPITLDYYHSKCVEIFGSEVGVPQTEWVNQYYGGDHPKGTRIVYVTGSQDPWTARPNGAGYTQSNDPLQPAIYIDGAHHCADISTPKDSDPPSLKSARKKIDQYITQWLAID